MEKRKDILASTTVDTLKDVVEQVVHDLVGPLSFLDLYVNQLSSAKKTSDVDAEEIASSARRSLEKVLGIVDSLKDSARESALKFGTHDFSAIVRSVISEVTAIAGKKDVKINYAGPDHLIGKFDESKVSRAIQNLVINAIEASNFGGDVSVIIMHSGRSVWIEVADSGSGVPEGLNDKIFDRGFSFGKEFGSGLGLAYCKSVVEMHGGSVNVVTREGQGAAFTLSFPLSAVLAAEKIKVAKKEKVKATLLDDGDEMCGAWVSSMFERYSSVEFVEPRVPGEIYSEGEITLDP